MSRSAASLWAAAHVDHSRSSHTRHRRLNTAPCGMPFALPPCGHCFRPSEIPALARALLTEPFVERQLACLSSKRSICTVCCIDRIPRHNHTSMVGRDRDPVRHIGRVERDATHFLRRSRIGDVETHHRTPRRYGDEIVVSDDDRDCAARAVLARERANLRRASACRRRGYRRGRVHS